MEPVTLLTAAVALGGASALGSAASAVAAFFHRKPKDSNVEVKLPDGRKLEITPQESPEEAQKKIAEITAKIAEARSSSNTDTASLR